MRTITPPSLEDIPAGLDPKLRELLEGIVYGLDLREGRAAQASNARFARQEDRVVTEVFYRPRTTITATIPFDNTVPQNTEGTEILVATVTPKSLSHRLRIEFEVLGTASGATIAVAAALFQDAGVGAIYATALHLGDGWTGTIVGRHEMQVNTLNPTTFKVRVGVTSQTFYTNGGTGAEYFGPIPQASRLRIIELPSG